jgi:hypothetical protein
MEKLQMWLKCIQNAIMTTLQLDYVTSIHTKFVLESCLLCEDFWIWSICNFPSLIQCQVAQILGLPIKIVFIHINVYHIAAKWNYQGNKTTYLKNVRIHFISTHVFTNLERSKLMLCKLLELTPFSLYYSNVVERIL